MTNSAIAKTGLRQKTDAIARGLFDTLYNRLAALYEPLLVKLLGYSGHEVVAEALCPFLEDLDGVVLDAGCGTGLTALALQTCRPELTIDGFDIAPDMVAIAEKSGAYRELMVADATKPLPVERGTYAAAISSGLYTQGHVGAEAIAPVLDALRPGGLFGFYVYEPIFEKLGFAGELKRLVDDGAITVLEEEEASHFRRLANQSCRVFVVRKS
mgnify:CR=1 FL=1